MLGIKKAALKRCNKIVGDGGYFSVTDSFYLGSKKLLESEIEYLEEQISLIDKGGI